MTVNDDLSVTSPALPDAEESGRRGDSALTRKESKAVTRRRLLDAALRVLDEEGEGALTTTKITKLAGIAQSSFYVHFADMDDLLHCLIDELMLEWRRETRKARQVSRAAPLDAERFRETFRVPMMHSISHPKIFRLLVRSRLDSSSPLGEWSRSVHEDNRAALIEDMIASGFPVGTAADRRKAEMVADGIMALTSTMIMGHLEGQYPDLEEVIDVLVAFSLGYFTLYWPDADPAKVIGRAGRALQRR
jgi:TetR/AcrR family transcriptional regulator, fatty acid biosynthesis regulator